MSDQQVNLLFVKEVEKHPGLYNYKLPQYSNKDETEKAWNEVGKVVNMTVAECKERWKNIRAVFTRNMKYHRSSTGGKAKKAYYLLEAMQFTLPYIKALGTPSGNLHSPPHQEKIEQSQDNDTEGIALPPLQRLPLPSTQTAEMPQQRETLPGPSSSRHIPTRKRLVNNEALDKPFSDYFQAKKTKMLTKTGLDNQDEKSKGLKMFLLSMLPDLLKMSDEEVRYFKRKALETVDDILSRRSTGSPEITFSPRTSTPSSVSDMLLSPNPAHVPECTLTVPVAGGENNTSPAEGCYEKVHD